MITQERKTFYTLLPSTVFNSCSLNKALNILILYQAPQIVYFCSGDEWASKIDRAPVVYGVYFPLKKTRENKINK